MTTKYKILVGLGVLLVALLVFLEAQEPEGVNWFRSYAKTSKIPYGTFVLYETLSDTRTEDTFSEVNQPPFEFLSDSLSEPSGTYLFVNSVVRFDEAEAHKMLDWVSKGNTLFIAGNGIGSTILDTLNLEIDVYTELENFEHKPLVNLSNPELTSKTPFELDLEVYTSYFSEIDTLNTVVLGVYDLKKKDSLLKIVAPKVNFIQQPFGDGKIIVNLFPEAYSNYFLLKDDNVAYTEKTLSYIPENEHLYWDNHYKNGKVSYSSPLYILFQNRYLKWAYFMIIIGTLLWVIFEGKRKQRAIPIVKPLPNQTIAFTKTIAGMYLEQKDHKSIASHAIHHFLEWLRTDYQVRKDGSTLHYIERAALKTGNTVEDTKNLIDNIQVIENTPTITQEQLITLSKRIETFKHIATYGSK